MAAMAGAGIANAASGVGAGVLGDALSGAGAEGFSGDGTGVGCMEVDPSVTDGPPDGGDVPEGLQPPPNC